MVELTFEQKLKEFFNMHTDERFKENGCAYFSNGARAGAWFRFNLDKIFSLNNEYSKKIKDDYDRYINERNSKKEILIEKIKDKKILFLKQCNLFYNINDLNKFKKDSGFMLTEDLSAYDWFEFNKNKIFMSADEICHLIQIEYEKYNLRESKNKLIEYKKKAYEFYIEKSNNKFNSRGNLKFQDGTLKNRWFLENKNFIINSTGVFEEKIKEQYDTYLKLNELKKEFLSNPNLEKYDENSNIRFASGALMYFFFEQNYNDISSSNNEIDKKIMKDYENYIMIKDLYYDDEKEFSYEKN